MKTKKVIQISLSYIADDERISREKRALSELGFHVFQIGRRSKNDPKKPGFSHLTPLFIVRLTRYCLYVGRVDYIVAHDWTALPLAWFVRKICKGELVYNSHELGRDEQRDSLIWQIVRSKCAILCERLFVSVSTKVVTVSDGLAHKLKNYLNLSALPLVIRNVPDIQVGKRRSQTHVYDGELRIVFCGHIIPHRGVEQVLEAVACLRRPFSLTFLGDAPSGYRRQLDALTLNLKINERVSFHPAVAYEVLIEHLQKNDVGIYVPPASSEHLFYSLPNKLFEYFHSSLVVCASNFPDISALLGHGKYGILVEGGNIAALAQALDSLDEDAISAYKNEARARAKSLVWSVEKLKLRQLFS